MADTENREDQKISECLREAFGYSDDQLLKQLIRQTRLSKM